MDRRGARHFPVTHADFDRLPDANCDSYLDRNRNADPLGIADHQCFRDIHRVGDRNRNLNLDRVGKPDHERFGDADCFGDRNCNLNCVGKPNCQRHADRIDYRDGDSNANRDRYDNFNCDCHCQRD
jgi:hypothetical protein